jgi:hypothetical protein
MSEFNPKKNKRNLSVTLSPRALNTLGDMADLYKCSRSAVIDQLLVSYGSKLIRNSKPKEATQ